MLCIYCTYIYKLLYMVDAISRNDENCKICITILKNSWKVTKGKMSACSSRVPFCIIIYSHMCICNNNLYLARHVHINGKCFLYKILLNSTFYKL